MAMSSEDLKLGEIIPADRPQERDAVHIAVIPVVAAVSMAPGALVGMAGGRAVHATGAAAIGIVDPFLTETVEEGQRFWLYLRPGSITSLRHEWTHPAFPVSELRVGSNEREVSEKWLRQWAIEFRVGGYDIADDERYRKLIGGAIAGDIFFGTDTPYDEVRGSELWRHIENVTGQRFDDDHRENGFYHCSC